MIRPASRPAAYLDSADSADSGVSVGADLRQSRLRAHAATGWSSAGAAALVGMLLVWALAIAPMGGQGRGLVMAQLVGWSLALAGVIGCRLWMSRAGLARSGAAPTRPDGLTRFRAVIALHGVVWGSVAWLPASLADAALQAVLLTVLLGLVFGAVGQLMFDLRAAALFVLPALLPLVLRLALLPGPLPVTTWVTALMALLLLGMLAVSARRVSRARHAQARTRHAQAEQLRMLALVQAHTEQGFWTIDNRFVTIDANPAMCRMLGCTLDQMLGRSIYDFVDASQAQVFAQQVARRAQGHAGGYEISLRRLDGSRVHCFNNATPLRDDQGHKIGALGLFSDISAQKRAELQIRQTGELLAQKTQVLEHTLENIHQGVLHVDAQGVCIAWNSRFLALLEIDPAWMQNGLPGQPPGPLRFDDLSRYQIAQGHLGEDLEHMDAAGRVSVQRFLRGEVEPGSTRYQRLRADGMVLDVASQRGPDGSLVRTYTDITVQTRAQAALTAARDDAERANRAKSAFLSRMSHELRTPMNAILGFGQLLAADEQDRLSPGQTLRVSALLSGGRHLLALIDDVLAIASIEAGRLALKLQPVDLAGLARECLALMQPVAQARGVRLAWQGPARVGPAAQAAAAVDPHELASPACWVQADATRLRQVLLNLLSNAIKFNREGGHVGLSVSAVGAQVQVEVADQGPGIQAEHLPRLFRPFERLDRDASTEGSGIGLALSHSLVGLMHGELGVRSQPAQGSVFWLRLPGADRPLMAQATPLPTPRLMPRSAPRINPARRSVLYIEDNPVNLLLMEGMLARCPNLHLRLAELPEQGLAMAARQAPDLVLLDIQLPGINGFEVLRRLRALPGLQALPVIAVSANAMPADLALAEQAGFDAYLSKPVDMAQLLAEVEAALTGLPAERAGVSADPSADFSVDFLTNTQADALQPL